MTILTGRELEVLVGLRMSWGKLYSKELGRLLNEEDEECAVDPPSPTIFQPSDLTFCTASQRWK
jgi:hypothetical protein